MMTVTGFAKTQNIGGKVFDEKGEPLPFVNVVLLSLPDSAFVQGAMTDAQGLFNIVTDKSEGLLKLTSIGYQTLYHPFKATDELLLQMKEDTLMLGEVVVKGHLPKTKLTGEGMQTNILGSVLENVGSANDVLARTPGMMKGKNGLEVIGKGTPLYYINGRKVTDNSELERLQSNEIQSIEVITNPGAQYDATVLCVVRIRTIRRQGDGFGFNLNASDSQSLHWSKGYSPFGAVGMNYRTGGVDIFASVNYSRDTSRQDSYAETASYGISQDGDNYLFENKGDVLAEYIGQTLYGTTGVNWQITNDHSLGGKIEWGKKLEFSEHTVVTSDVFENGTQVDGLTTTSDDDLGDKHFYNLGANLYYNGTVNEKLGIDVNMDYYGTDYSTQSVSREVSTMTHDAEIFSSNYNTGRLYAVKGVLSYPVWKGQLQAGTEETFSRRTDSYAIKGIDIPSSEAKVKEDNYAGFASYACLVPKVGQLSAGVRYEYVRYNYADVQNPSANLTRSYSNLFPTFAFSAKAGPVQLMLNYGIKTRRPNYGHLSSAIHYNSRYIWQSGNTQLQPELSHNVGVTAQWRFMTLSVNYTHTNDAIMIWSAPYNDEGVVLVKPRNIETPHRVMTALVNLSPTIGPWTMNYTVGIQPQWLTINASDPREPSGIRVTKFNNRPIGFAQLFNTLTLKQGWQFELGGSLNTKGYFENIRATNVYFDLTAAIQKKLLKDGALVLRLEGSDLTNTAHYNVDTDFGCHTIRQTNRMDTQKIKFSVRYTFNTAQSKYRGTGAGKDAQERMK
ncbi:MAG: TonB-dependent receptor family protein [Prevotella sp.]|nr:TonB-dependent receptor family protein [Prevotella sp.]